MSRKSEIQKTYTARGLERFQIEIWHDELNKYQLIKGISIYEIEQKALSKMQQWDDMWEKKQLAEKKSQNIENKKNVAQKKTEKAQKMLNSINEILNHTLNIDDTIDWESLKSKEKFPISKPQRDIPPQKPIPQEIPFAPNPKNKKYIPKIGFFDKFSKTKQESKRNQSIELFKKDQYIWEENRRRAIITFNKAQKEYDLILKELDKKYRLNVKKWENSYKEYLKIQKEKNKIIDLKKEKYFNCESKSIVDYCEMVLSNSEYPEGFPQEYELDYNPDNKLIVVDYQFPPLNAIPTLKEVKYIQTRDELSEKHISQSQLNKMYDEVLYQITLRTIHELYEADKVDGLDSIVFNGYVTSIDPTIGQETNACILSVQANKEEFLQINLAMIESKACFKKLKGVGSSKLNSMTPIAPIIRIERDDKRFVASYGVVDDIGEGDNLAAMDWEDFEHLIRELFEQAFTEVGGEVRVTQASRDGGVDAVIFDPDPLRGGKIVVQAKRYTNVVGVSAVRDLYGTLLNEGANKGILVTTSDYGPDAYSFAKGKPIQLLNGSNLLHLLEKHGHKAKIDLKEAKQILLEKEREAM